MYIIVFVLCAALLAACGGSDSGPTAAPSPTTTSITVTLDNPVKIGDTKQASATATLSNGTSQPLTTGFQSDSPNVATTTPTGAVTGVGNGFATVYIISGGRQ